MCLFKKCDGLHPTNNGILLAEGGPLAQVAGKGLSVGDRKQT